MSMNRLIAIAALMTALVPAPRAWAGADSSGGGLGLVCFKKTGIAAEIRKNGGVILDSHIDEIESVEAFDLYEAKLTRGLQEELVPELIDVKEGESEQAYVERIRKRFEQTVPLLSEMIKDSAHAVPLKFIIMQPHGVKPVSDAEEMGLIDSEKCVLATMALHRKTNTQYFLHFDRRLFFHKSHSKLSRAVLLLHEYVYMAARRMEQTDSSKTRAMVALMITANSGKTVEDFMNLAYDLGFSKQRAPSYLMFVAYDIARALGVTFDDTIQNFKRSERVALMRRAHELLKGTPNESNCKKPVTQDDLRDLGNATGCFSTITMLVYTANLYHTPLPPESVKLYQDMRAYLLALKAEAAKALELSYFKKQPSLGSVDFGRDDVLALPYLDDDRRKAFDGAVKALIADLDKKIDAGYFDLLYLVPIEKRATDEFPEKIFATEFGLILPMRVDHRYLVPVIR